MGYKILGGTQSNWAISIVDGYYRITDTLKKFIGEEGSDNFIILWGWQTASGLEKIKAETKDSDVYFMTDKSKAEIIGKGRWLRELGNMDLSSYWKDQPQWNKKWEYPYLLEVTHLDHTILEAVKELTLQEGTSIIKDKKIDKGMLFSGSLITVSSAVGGAIWETSSHDQDREIQYAERRFVSLPSRDQSPIEEPFSQEDEPMALSSHIENIHRYLASRGFHFSREEIANYYLCLKTKPFVILAGISGTGKTQLVRLFADAINSNFTQIPVKPDWTDNSDLIGFKNLEGNFEKKELLTIIGEASKKENADKIFFVLLDEMNLARVEHYFSDFLSVIETRRKENGRIITDNILHESEVGKNDKVLSSLYFPDNLYLVGTVNMDETTHPFSRKVLDRANSIELNEVNLEWPEAHLVETKPLNDVDNNFLKARYVRARELTADEKVSLSPVLQTLTGLNDILRRADLQFGYRVRDEICFYMLYQKDISDMLPFETALDFQIMQKILPRIQGSSQRIKRVLIDLIKELSGKNNIGYEYDYELIEKAIKEVSVYRKSINKLLFMLRRFEDDGFTSFWL